MTGGAAPQLMHDMHRATLETVLRRPVMHDMHHGLETGSSDQRI
jgi:hypothetical protein